MLVLLLVNSVKFLPYRVKLPEYVFTANIDVDRWHLLSLSVLKELSEFLPYFFPYLLLEFLKFLTGRLIHRGVLSFSSDSGILNSMPCRLQKSSAAACCSCVR